ncbi:hypothetical protein SK128_002656 [Halocaridina rubra]|uniref:Uncharacterized protein n=1 Tax=Halocaridina rubra TaxID=373956 RepID=A0AAN8WJ58_HALRR
MINSCPSRAKFEPVDYLVGFDIPARCSAGHGGPTLDSNGLSDVLHKLPHGWVPTHVHRFQGFVEPFTTICGFWSTFLCVLEVAPKFDRETGISSTSTNLHTSNVSGLKICQYFFDFCPLRKGMDKFLETWYDIIFECKCQSRQTLHECREVAVIFISSL